MGEMLLGFMWVRLLMVWPRIIRGIWSICWRRWMDIMGWRRWKIIKGCRRCMNIMGGRRNIDIMGRRRWKEIIGRVARTRVRLRTWHNVSRMLVVNPIMKLR